MRACAIVPAFDAERTVARVVESLRDVFGDAVFVVDDGSADATAQRARDAGARVVSHGRNRGKGAALRTGFAEAGRLGFDVAVTVDADGQHPASSARIVLEGSPDPAALVAGVRDLARDGAPPASAWANGVSDFWVSFVLGRPFRDTQGGLRRYPVAATLALGTRSDGYAIEAEMILRAAAAGIPIVEVAVDVIYPSAEERVTHFHKVRDPARIFAMVVRTTFELHLLWRRS